MIGFTQIAATVAVSFGMTPAQVLSRSNARDIVEARHVAVWLAKRHSGRPNVEIGPGFGYGDHSNVSYALDHVETRMKEDARFKQVVLTLEQAILFKIDMSERGTIDVLPLARRIYANPRREATAATLHEITALASVLLDLWDVAQAAVELADANGDRAAELGRTIKEEIAALCGQTPDETEETTNG